MPCHIGVLFFHPIHFVGFPPIETTLIIALSIHYDEELNCWFFASSLTIIKFWQVESLKKLEYFWILIYTKFFIYLFIIIIILFYFFGWEVNRHTKGSEMDININTRRKLHS